jgi:hypothetical protein
MLSKLSVNDSMSVPQTDVGNGERSQISQALAEPTIEAAMLRPLAIHQCIPNSERVHRARPRICRYQVTDEEYPKCAFCLENLTRGKKYYCFKWSSHAMHARCAMDNVIDNGIDPMYFIRPRICRFQVTNEENPRCAYCLLNLTRGKKYYCFKQCYHIMHARCAMNNLINNGIDPKSCTMFCPICHPRSVSDRYHY